MHLQPTTDPAAGGPRPAPRRSTLRVALGMRGGVSLAVWIGGGVAELDELRRAHRQGGFYRSLLALGCYDRVEIDVMSGASAGGLNAVLAAACFAGGQPVRAMRDTWLAAGGFERLLDPPPTDAGRGGPRDHDRRSLLSGDYFLEQVRASVARFLGDGTTFDHRVDVFLSATALRGLSIGIHDDPFAPDEARRSDALFHFRHHGPTPASSDFVGPTAAADLATAARTTASYPVAFEPVPFEPGRLPGVLQLPAATTQAVELLDGGVVDNIPVARALRGVPNIPADTPTDRWIMYLQPSPGLPAVERRVAPPGRAPGIVAVLAGLGNALRSESILDDVEAVRHHNVAAVDSWRAWAACVGRLPDAPPAAVGTPDLTYDATRIHALLLDPAAELVWRPISTALPPSPLTGLSGFARDALRAGLEEAVAGLARSPRPFAAHARVAAFLTRWAREAEGAEDDRGASAAKRRAYSSLHLAQLLTVNAEWHTLTTLATSVAADGVAVTMCAWSDRARRSPEVASVVRALRAGVALDDLDGPTAATVERLRACGFEPDPPGTGEADAAALMWEALGDIARALAADEACTARIRRTADTTTIIDLAQRVAAHPDGAERYLQLVDERTGGVHEGIAMGLARPFKYIRAAGSNLSPAALAPADLAFEGPRFRSSELAVAPGATAMDASLKLAGSAMANFSAFMSPRWRANDWMWGRLDLVKSIVDVVTSPGRLPDAATVLAEVREALTGPVGDEAGAWAAEVQAAGQRLWDDYASTIGAEVAGAVTADPRERLLTTRRLLVLRRQWEVLAAELPGVLTTPLRPAAPPADPEPVRTLQEAVATYERAPRALSTVWGQGWLTALGMRTAYALWTATRPEAAWKRWLRTPLKPLPMALLGFLLARHRTVCAVAMVLGLVAAPHVASWLAWLVWGLAVAFVLGGLVACRAREGPPPVPLEAWAPLLRAGAVASLAASAALVATRPSWLFHELGTWSFGEVHGQVTTDVIVAPLVTGLATALVWHWSPWRWRVLVTLVVAAVFAVWSVWSTAAADGTPVAPLRVALVLRSMVWAGVVATLLATSVAHRGFRRGTIADYAKG